MRLFAQDFYDLEPPIPIELKEFVRVNVYAPVGNVSRNISRPIVNHLSYWKPSTTKLLGELLFNNNILQPHHYIHAASKL